jgi:hypothetical protein
MKTFGTPLHRRMRGPLLPQLIILQGASPGPRQRVQLAAGKLSNVR